MLPGHHPPAEASAEFDEDNLLQTQQLFSRKVSFYITSQTQPAMFNAVTLHLFLDVC